MNTRLLSLIFIFFGFYNSYGQELPTVLPPSPNAASLAQYADTPVSNYTGIPNISIPLFTAKSGKMQLPITLNYHASGVKVAQEASWVGLGWSLNAGGMITRQIRGEDDFLFLSTPLKYYNDDNSIDWDAPANWDHTTRNYFAYLSSILGQYSSGIDSQPDVFYYNFFGYSGKFMFKKGNPYEIVTIDQNNLNFSFDNAHKTWTIIDGNGWTYYLGANNGNWSAIEETKTMSRFDGASPSTADNGKINYIERNSGYGEFKQTAWYIYKAVNPEGDEIEFSYDDVAHQTIGQINYSQTDYDVADASNSPNITYSTLESKYTASQQNVDDVYLKRIDFDNGYIKFNTSDRIDMRRVVTNVQNPQKLSSIEVFDLGNNLIKKIELSHTYFEAPPHIQDKFENYRRLRLDAITESYLDANDVYVEANPYTFTYDTTGFLPKKTSFSVDHWGYFNDENNYSLAPYYYEGTYPDGTRYGARRDPDSRTVQRGVLKSIGYPTAGSVHFEYESNTYEAPVYRDIPVEAVDYLGAESVLNTNSFSISSLQRIKINAYVYNNDGNITSDILNDEITLTLKDVNENIKYSVAVNVEPDEVIDYGEDFSVNVEQVLAPGTYYLKAENHSGNDNLDIGIIAKHPVLESFDKVGSGLRIKSITNKDNINNNFLSKKQYRYSGGVLMTHPNYIFSEGSFGAGFTLQTDFGLPEGTTHPPTFRIPLFGSLHVRSSSSVVPLANSAQGSPIGYDKVTVKREDEDGNTLGGTHYEYRNTPNDGIFNTYFPGLLSRSAKDNGLLAREESFNESGDVLKIKTMDYEENLSERDAIKTLSTYRFSRQSVDNEDTRADAIFILEFQDIYSEWWHPTSTVETVYDTAGENPVTTTTTYEYGNASHKNITKTTTTNSKDEVIETINEYPSDYPSGTGMNDDLFETMVANNILNPVIKQQTKLGSSVLSTQVTSYKNWGDDLFLPDVIKTAKGTGSLEPRIIYHTYSEEGNPLEVSKADGTHIVYFWGYRKNSPIAKIEGVTFAQVASALEVSENSLKNWGESHLSSINNLRNTLPAARVTTYTYDPLIGVTSITDPRGQTINYEYDDFHRLKQVKDADGHVLSHNKYHYKGQ